MYHCGSSVSSDFKLLIQFKELSALIKNGPRFDYETIVINGKRYQALVDNQASLNIMSLAFANSAGLTIHSDATAFRLSNGSLCHAVGRVRVHCYFAQMDHELVFFVLPKTSISLVLGLSFLFNVSPGRVSNLRTYGLDPEELLNSTTAKRHSRLCFKAYLSVSNRKWEAIAMPDNGASINMISLSCVKGAGFPINQQSAYQKPIVLGNGQILYTIGKIHAMMRFSEHAITSIPCSFAVIDGLFVDVILSHRFLRNHHILANYQNQLQWIHFKEGVPGFHHSGGTEKRRRVKPSPRQNDDPNRAKVDSEVNSMQMNALAARDRMKHITPVASHSIGEVEPIHTRTTIVQSANEGNNIINSGNTDPDAIEPVDNVLPTQDAATEHAASVQPHHNEKQSEDIQPSPDEIMHVVPNAVPNPQDMNRNKESGPAIRFRFPIHFRKHQKGRPNTDRESDTE